MCVVSIETAKHAYATNSLYCEIEIIGRDSEIFKGLAYSIC